jgi:CheY-like chemotaxis protein
VSRKKIIIVDEDRVVRERLRNILETAGYLVDQANTALRLLSTLHIDRPDLIVCDQAMSWLDGRALCGAIKRNPVLAPIPIILLGEPREATPLPADCGAAAYLDDDFEPRTLLAEVHRLIG